LAIRRTSWTDPRISDPDDSYPRSLWGRHVIGEASDHRHHGEGEHNETVLAMPAMRRPVRTYWNVITPPLGPSVSDKLRPSASQVKHRLRRFLLRTAPHEKVPERNEGGSDVGLASSTPASSGLAGNGRRDGPSIRHRPLACVTGGPFFRTGLGRTLFTDVAAGCGRLQFSDW
jgi:hypothetical protein